MTYEEPWYIKVEREAGEKLAALLAQPLPETEYDIGSLDEDGNDLFFDPWAMFPLLYGNYSGEFDACAIAVLEELRDNRKTRSDLGAEMFREMLCNLHLCSYGTSPRVCFPTTDFRLHLPALIAKWRAYSLLHWGVDVTQED